MTKQEIEKFVDQMSADQLRQYAIIGYMSSIIIGAKLLKILNGKGSQGKP